MVIDPNLSDIANALVVDMPLFSESFSVPVDGPFDTTFDVDDLGHQVRVQIQKREPSGECRRGWVSGRWPAPIHHRQRGRRARRTFMGMMSNVAGDELAAIKGFYGVNREGQRVLFGKGHRPRGPVPRVRPGHVDTVTGDPGRGLVPRRSHRWGPVRRRLDARRVSGP